MHPSPASNLLTRRSLDAYHQFFQEERRRLLEEQEDGGYYARSSLKDPQQRRRRRRRRPSNNNHHHQDKIDFRDSARLVASNWKALEPEEQASYYHFAAAAKAIHQTSRDEGVKKHSSYSSISDKNNYITNNNNWKHNWHSKKDDALGITNDIFEISTPQPPPFWIEDPGDDDVMESVVVSVIEEEGEEQSNATAASATTASTTTQEDSDENPCFWPLQGATSYPIADFIRSHRYPQLTLNHSHTCMPCDPSSGSQKRHACDVETLRCLLNADNEQDEAFFLDALMNDDNDKDE